MAPWPQDVACSRVLDSNRLLDTSSAATAEMLLPAWVWHASLCMVSMQIGACRAFVRTSRVTSITMGVIAVSCGEPMM